MARLEMERCAALLQDFLSSAEPADADALQRELRPLRWRLRDPALKRARDSAAR